MAGDLERWPRALSMGQKSKKPPMKKTSNGERKWTTSSRNMAESPSPIQSVPTPTCSNGTTPRPPSSLEHQETASTCRPRRPRRPRERFLPQLSTPSPADQVNTTCKWTTTIMSRPCTRLATQAREDTLRPRSRPRTSTWIPASEVTEAMVAGASAWWIRAWGV